MTRVGCEFKTEADHVETLEIDTGKATDRRYLNTISVKANVLQEEREQRESIPDQLHVQNSENDAQNTPRIIEDASDNHEYAASGHEDTVRDSEYTDLEVGARKSSDTASSASAEETYACDGCDVDPIIGNRYHRLEKRTMICAQRAMTP